jgi:predicted ATPase
LTDALFKLKRAIENMAVYDSFNTSSSSPVRLPTQAVSTMRLNSDGSNLAPLLNSLENRSSNAYDQIIQQIGRINPNFRDISISNQASYQHLALREKSLARSIQAEHISDGTLRYLMLLAIAFNPERGRILGVDEPENGLHPDMLNTVTTVLKDATNDHTQLILATHSPLVINAFEPEDVLVFDKTANNETSVKSPDDEELEEYFDQYTLGQLWLMGKIGAKRW